MLNICYIAYFAQFVFLSRKVSERLYTTRVAQTQIGALSAQPRAARCMGDLFRLDRCLETTIVTDHDSFRKGEK